MLQSIRDKSQGWIAWTIIGLLIATFALWGVHAYVNQSKHTEVAAKVAGVVISQKDVQTAYERLRQQQQLQLGADFALNQTTEAQLRKQALNQIIMSTLLVKAANESGYRVTTSQVNEALLQIPAFQVNGQFSVNRFHEILNSLLYTQDQFLADLRQSMLINQVEGGYINSAFALPNQITTAIQLINQKRDINYTIIPAARFANKQPIDPTAIKNYYQSHLQEFKSPEQVSIDYLLLSLPTIKAGLHFDQTKLQQYYENNLQSYTQPARWHVAYILVLGQSNDSLLKAQAIASAATTNKNFSQLATSYSADKKTAAKGGELPWFTAGTYDPTFEKAVSELQKPGDISPPTKTRFGYVIIKLLAKTPAQVLPFEKVQKQVNDALAEQQAEQIFATEGDKLANLTYANANSLKAASQSLNLPILTTSLFGRGGTKTGITANPRVVATAFSQDVLVQHNNSDVLNINPRNMLVLRVNQVKPASVLPLPEVAATIQTRLQHEAATQQAVDLGQQLLVQLKNNQATPIILGQRYHLPWQVDKNASRYDGKIDNAILHEAFRMPFFKDQPSVSGLLLPSGDYALIMLTAVNTGAVPPANSFQWRIFNEQFAHSNGAMDYEFYAQGLMKKAKVKLTPVSHPS